MTIQLVMFDMAGTTVDDRIDGEPLVISAMRQAFRNQGLAVSYEQVNAQRGRAKPQMVAALLDEIGAAPALQSTVYETFHGQLLANLAQIKPLGDVASVFQALRGRGIRIGVGSGFPTDVVEGIVERLGWARAGLVDYYASSEQVGAGRPSPAMVQAAMAAVAVSDPRRVVKVGDTVMDVMEGRNAGVWTVAVLTGTQGQARLKVAEPDAILDSIEQVPAWIAERFD